MKTRIIQTKFWEDSFISSLTAIEKLIFLYYLTNEKVNIIFCYECPDKYAALDIGVSIEVLKKAQAKFAENGKMIFYKGYVKLLNADKYERYTGDKNEGAKQNLIREMSPDVLAWYNNVIDTPIYTPMDRGEIPSINHKSEIISHKSEIKGIVKGELSEEDFIEVSQAYDVPLPFVLSKWDDIKNYCDSTGKKYKDYKAALRHWVKKDAMSIRKEEYGKSKLTVVG